MSASIDARSSSPRLLPSDLRASIAVDLGAESCRVSLLRWIEDAAHIELVRRFPNAPVADEEGRMRWPLDSMLRAIDDALIECAARAPEGIRSIAVDGWAVDYVRLDAHGTPVAAPFCYRDERTVPAETGLTRTIAAERLEAITGVRTQRINTLFQMVADRDADLPAGHMWLNLPEFLLHRWGAPAIAEHTNAAHTQMVEAGRPAWSAEILRAADIDAATMPAIVPAGTKLGRLRGPLAGHPAFESTELIAPACHDTASAVAGIVADGDDWAYISSGTWSLVGALLTEPCMEPAVFEDGFTNLAAVAGKVCFHCGVNGLWLLRQCMEAWSEAGGEWTIDELLLKAEQCAAPSALIDVDDPDLLLVGNMPRRINVQLRRRGLTVLDETPAHAPQMASLICHSLTERYRLALERLRQHHTGKTLRRIHVVGGGSRNALLRRLTSEKTGLPVICGSPESSTLGNLAVQLASLETGVDSPEFASSVRRWAGTLSTSRLG